MGHQLCYLIKYLRANRWHVSIEMATSCLTTLYVHLVGSNETKRWTALFWHWSCRNMGFRQWMIISGKAFGHIYHSLSVRIARVCLGALEIHIVICISIIIKPKYICLSLKTLGTCLETRNQLFYVYKVTHNSF